MFQIRNHATHSFGFAGRMCIAGSGCPTPPAAAKFGVTLPPLFEMSAEDMFKSWRGVVAAMKELTPKGLPAIEVLIDGEVIGVQEIEAWAVDYRAAKGLPTPRNSADHAAEVTRAMNRPEDPIEAAARRERDERDRKLVETVLAAVREAR